MSVDVKDDDVIVFFDFGVEDEFGTCDGYKFFKHQSNIKYSSFYFSTDMWLSVKFLFQLVVS